MALMNSASRVSNLGKEWEVARIDTFLSKLSKVREGRQFSMCFLIVPLSLFFFAAETLSLEHKALPAAFFVTAASAWVISLSFKSMLRALQPTLPPFNCQKLWFSAHSPKWITPLQLCFLLTRKFGEMYNFVWLCKVEHKELNVKKIGLRRSLSAWFSQNPTHIQNCDLGCSMT